jgi:excinuclease UvrABC nuclease subunit
MKKLNKENISKLKNNEGIYYLFNCSGKKVYVGSSKVLKHRLQSYYQKDDYSINKTKRNLRKNLCFFESQNMDISKARKIEKSKKEKLTHNHL